MKHRRRIGGAVGAKLKPNPHKGSSKPGIGNSIGKFVEVPQQESGADEPRQATWLQRLRSVFRRRGK